MSFKNILSSTSAFFEKFDMFAAPVPNFNVRGRTEVKTLVGSFMSIGIMTLTMMFALLKLQFMLLRKSPVVSSFIDEEGHGASTPFNIIENDDFMMAFSASNWSSGAKSDSRYI